MSQTNTEAHKRARKKWIENNKDFHSQLCNMYTKNYYQNNREQRLEYAKQYREKKKAKKETNETLGEIDNLEKD
jgi:DNA-binding GntR family transcriptional regulator